MTRVIWSMIKDKVSMKSSSVVTKYAPFDYVFLKSSHVVFLC